MVLKNTFSICLTFGGVSGGGGGWRTVTVAMGGGSGGSNVGKVVGKII